MPSQKLNNVTITLISDCMGRPRAEKKLDSQAIRFSRGEKIARMGVDGHMSVGGTVHSVEWISGNENDLKDVTQVVIAGSRGETIVSGDLSWNQLPRIIADGIHFWINPEA